MNRKIEISDLIELSVSLKNKLNSLPRKALEVEEEDELEIAGSKLDNNLDNVFIELDLEESLLKSTFFYFFYY